MKHREGLSAEDRTARSQLHQLLEKADGLIHGSLIQMARCCGNPNCRCAREDKKHLSWYLGVTKKAKTSMKHLTPEQRLMVQRWVKNYQETRRLLEKMSEEAWRKLSSD